MQTEQQPAHLLLAVAAWLCLAGTVEAEDSEAPLAIEGYSPVSYFEEGRPERGSPEHSTVYNQRTYHFTSEEQLERFEADPESYEPLFPDHCPYNLALGREAAIDPTNYKIVDGHLLLFHRSEEMDGLEAWENHEDSERELLERARGQYTLFRF